ncbi:MAG: hypothetical protein HY001_01665 [Candidatus Portnoybacteria bacterium]|nr:hypothetical protein [Candidatus Portnoybacteria bacterium]
MANHRQRIAKPEGAARGVFDFLDKNWQGVAIILGIIAVFVWYQALGLSRVLDWNRAITGISTGIKETAQQLTPSKALPETSPLAQEIQTPVIPSTFPQKAAPRQGITHLGRQALDDYLQAAKPQITLSREQKIYIEDYLKDQTKASRGAKPLLKGEQVSFSTDTIRKAVELSQTLTPKQLANLTKYANRVPSLQTYQPLAR